jgi:hypothetical protein
VLIGELTVQIVSLGGFASFTFEVKMPSHDATSKIIVANKLQVVCKSRISYNDSYTLTYSTG